MPGTDTDAKSDDAGEIGGVVGGESSTSHLDMEHFSENSDNLISTIDDDGSEDFGAVDISSGGARDQEVKATETTTDKVETETETAVKVETEVDAATTADDAAKADITIEKIPEQFDKHPAWQKLMNKIETLETKLVEKVETETKTDPDIVDIDTLTEEDIAEWRTDDPIGYDKNLRALATRDAAVIIRAELKAEADEKRTANTFDTYAEENKENESGTGFMQMWNDGQLQAYMDQNPGHNAISAHLKLTETSKAQSTQAQIDAGIAAGVAKEKARLAAETKARKRTVGLGQGPAYTATDTSDDELKDTSKRGGKVAVMADRLRRMRQGA